MGLSIKNEETERLVRELARRRGIGVTTAIRLAVSNELANLPPKKDPEQIAIRVRETQELWKQLPKFMTDKEVDAWMYDDDGLPH